MTLEELLQNLKELRRPSNLLGKTEYFPVISSEHFRDVEVLIRQYALDNHDAEMGILQAKVYAYEQIIANSNFKTILGAENEQAELEEVKSDICDNYCKYPNIGEDSPCETCPLNRL